MNYFKELKVWQKAIELVTETYLKTQTFPKEEIYGLTSQIRRAAIYIPSNIAEGTGRSSNKEFQHFLDYSIGSLFELETQIILSCDLKIINSEDFEKINQEIKTLIRMIIKFKSVLKI